MKIDLHVHSRFSASPSQWILRKIGCPECFVAPMEVYNKALAHGMDAVTITDHDTIDGALEIAHLPNTFVSEEVTALFPEDKCKIHVVAYNIDEAIHQDLQHLRENIYDLAEYLQVEHILHTVAHPLFAVNDKLTLNHVEKLLLLFKHFECNGTRDPRINETIAQVLESLTPALIGELSGKHGLEPNHAEPWIKFMTGGSDDHSGLNTGRVHTLVPGAASVEEFLRAITRGECQPGGEYATPISSAHMLYSIGYQFYKNKYNLGRHVNKDPFLKFLDRLLTPESKDDNRPHIWAISQLRQHGFLKTKAKAPSNELHRVLRNEAEAVFDADKTLQKLSHGPLPSFKELETTFFNFVCKTTNNVMMELGGKTLESLTKANPFQVLQNLASASGLYTILSPYFVFYSLFAKDRHFASQILERFTGARAQNSHQMKMAHFTDTFFETNGVALTLQRQQRTALKLGHSYRIITCHPKPDFPEGGVINFTPMGSYELPEYPDLHLYHPSFLEMLDVIHRENFTHIQVSTPGPVGLSGLLIAKILKLPVYGTYHTSLPQYAAYLTGDHNMEELLWKAMVWFYNSMDRVYAPSKSTGGELADKGVPRDKIMVYPRGVDVERFNPKYRNGFFKRYEFGEQFKILYVGRISKEKNLHILEQAFTKLVRNNVPAVLVVVGDGPYRQKMELNLSGLPCIFTGALSGNDLVQAFASSDLFVFPSITDTFGNVVLEAQASGVPVIVTDKGGPQENILPQETGLVIPGDNADSLYESILQLIGSPNRLKDMGVNARSYMETRSFEKAFNSAWQLYI